MTELNALSDQLTMSVAAAPNRVDRLYRRLWSVHAAEGLTLSARQNPQLVEPGVNPRTPRPAALVDVRTRDRKYFCLVSVAVLPGTLRTPQEHAKAVTNVAPYYTITAGSCDEASRNVWR